VVDEFGAEVLAGANETGSPAQVEYYVYLFIAFWRARPMEPFTNSLDTSSPFRAELAFIENESSPEISELQVEIRSQEKVLWLNVAIHVTFTSRCTIPF
jgi:hypothetical protein